MDNGKESPKGGIAAIELLTIIFLFAVFFVDISTTTYNFF